MKPAPENPLLDDFYRMIELWIDEDGLRIGHGMSRHEDGSNTVLALMLVDMAAVYETMIAHIYRSREKNPITALAFGWDRYTLMGQGNLYKDCISIHFLDLAKPLEWRYGVIDYQPPKDGLPKIVEPVNWANGAWDRMLQEEAAKAFGIIRERAIAARNAGA